MSAAGGSPSWRGGAAVNRFGERRIIIVFAVMFLSLAAVAVLIAALGQPTPPKPVCPNRQPCGAPPRRIQIPHLAASANTSSPALITSAEFISSALGYKVEYPAGSATGNLTATGITIGPPNGAPSVYVHIDGALNGSTSPQQMIGQQISFLQGVIPDLQIDNDPDRAILSPALGGWGGVGGFYQGTFNSPTGLTGPADVAIIAATDGQDTIGVSVVSADRSQTSSAFGYVDQAILDTLRFRSGVVP